MQVKTDRDPPMRGNEPCKLDSLTWTPHDVRADYPHPNEAGNEKTTALLLNCFKTNEGVRQWFVKPVTKPPL